jgi:hypothetical protein
MGLALVALLAMAFALSGCGGAGLAILPRFAVYNKATQNGTVDVYAISKLDSTLADITSANPPITGLAPGSQTDFTEEVSFAYEFVFAQAGTKTVIARGATTLSPSTDTVVTLDYVSSQPTVSFQVSNR